MYWCSCRLACILLHSFQSLSWGWVWMVLWIQMLFSIFYCTAGKLKRCQNLWGPFTLSLDCDGSELANHSSVVVDRYIVSFDVTDRYCFWIMVLCWFGLLGRFAWKKLICCFNANAEYRWAFLRPRFLAGGGADKTLDALSSRSVWFGPSLRPGKPSKSH